MMYDARPLNDVWNGDSVRQYGFNVVVGPNCAMLGDASGTAATIAHQSLTTLPVLVPPENVKPFTLRTLKFTSTPLNTRVSSPTSFVDFTSKFCTRVNASGVLLYSGPIWYPPPPGRRGSAGAVRKNGVRSLGPMLRSSVTVPPVVYCVNVRR